MITITNIRDVIPNHFDETWAIVRSLRGSHPKIIQVVDLSPSWDLFSKYRTLVNEGRWGRETFHEIYVPQFLHEMHSTKAKSLLNQLYLLDKSGKNICLFCYCSEECLCHRSIIAGLLQGCGCNVNGVLGDYSEYFDMYNMIS